MNNPEVNFRHLFAITGTYGTYEHAQHSVPRMEHGHCTDDVARVLVATMREPILTRDVMRLAQTSMQFLVQAQGDDGRVRNRRSHYGTWFGPFSAEDCWGRAMWAFGTAAARLPYAGPRMEMRSAFTRGTRVESPYPRANAFAVLGAGEILRVEPTDAPTLAFLSAAALVLDRSEIDSDWRWPESRLEYANAVLPEALMVIGQHLNITRLVDDGLRQLEWLCAMETRNLHLSITPSGGRGRRDSSLQFDQQPIEVAALADACVRAYELTRDSSWLVPIKMAIDWFVGDNDLGEPMCDFDTGAGYDGLTAGGPNQNQGAESTLACLMTLQFAPLLSLVPSQ